ncbi:aminotransferase class I/II-fold pyridoxal phosphate-dependent enzyme, partial [Methanocorpusculum sp.]|nr:aminotransferase class I/II-fold pyridoxal phosphate-dependent enzyme [Methanocorpusculum sp.]
MSERPIISFLTEHADKHTVSFHMPGHKGSAIYRKFGYTEFLEKMMDCDITEIIGADNLFQTEGILKAAQDEYAKLYNVKRAYMLVNGTSGGVIAAIMASVPKGGKLVMARNSHKAIYNALLLADIQPVYAYPEMIEEYGISGEITAEEITRCLDENPDASAVILPSPNYYGICSDIRKIAEIVHARGKILIVDQAHGAHLKFFSDCGFSDMPQSAEEQGADIAVNSIHKTLASFTQSAALTFNSDLLDHYTLEDKLQMIQSTSPSYILMGSLDINADIIKNHKEEVFTAWHDALVYFYAEAENISGLAVIRDAKLDFTKINLDMSAYGLSGAELEQMLMEKGIYAELTTGNILMCMTGIGNTKADMEKLLEALREIAASHLLVEGKKQMPPAVLEARFELCAVPAKKERIPLEMGAGRICASSIIPYPPGIPFICPGERITEEVITYIAALREAGEKVIGV